MGEQNRLVWFIFIRLVVVSLFLASTFILDTREPGFYGDLLLSSLTRLIIATYGFSLLTLLTLRLTDRYTRSITYLQLIWDLCFVTLLLLLTGGITSPYSFLYILSIINASVLLTRRDALYTASLCGILYGSILDLQYYGKLTVLGLSPLTARQFGANYIFYTIFVNIGAFYLTAFLTGYLAERARKSETALQLKAIDYEDLERQHSTIVTNLNSGLMTINSEGRIRVFNPYAEQLTGIKQAEAYNKAINDIFPNIDIGYERGEAEFRTPSGNILSIGFNAVPFTDVHDEVIGVIINFQDMTRIRRMEDALKRADRLAAIGELSARIAHEIRNPLASISGSVQLFAQGEGVTPQDRKLLEIVLRETDRLNGLLKDFLAYARPTQPAKVSVPLHQLLSDLIPLLESDPRFVGLLITNDCPRQLVVNADHDQLRQVFWNLLLNAAEAMPEDGGGEVYVKAELISGAETGLQRGNIVRIEIRDTGRGMSGNEVHKVFEPFFTTKQGGTGLGLATVYRIIESHSGAIFVDSRAGRGTTFTILLPEHENVQLCEETCRQKSLLSTMN